MKIFTLGCSFTKYYWPTWADILSESNPQIEVVNLARPAIGNVRIFYRLQELIFKKILTFKDRVIILWTSWHREDRCRKDQWLEEGNVFNSSVYGTSFTRKYWSQKFDIVKNCSAIIAANQLVNIDVNGSWLEISNTEKYKRDQIPLGIDYNSIYDDKYRFYLNKLPQFLKFDQRQNTNFGGKCSDRHPDILAHMHYADQIARKLGVKEADCDTW